MAGTDFSGAQKPPPFGESLWTATALLRRIEALRADFRIVGPTGQGNRASFEVIEEVSELALEYQSTMIPPAKKIFFPSRQELVRFETAESITVRDLPPAPRPTLLVGVHPCDLHAIRYLDQTLLADHHYHAQRTQTLIIGLNCGRVSPFCFCASMGTGPHLSDPRACDVLLTDLGGRYLLELGTRQGAELFSGGEPCTPEAHRLRSQQRQQALDQFSRSLDFQGLDQLLLARQEHPAWDRIADQSCLSCANCVMVCPTCFCHEVADEKDLDLSTTVRVRQWDGCQLGKFAAVHGGNYRSRRGARLRQFVLHKLAYTAQYGQPGTVGCGRCIQWCPTLIDLTAIADEIRRSSGAEPVPSR